MKKIKILPILLSVLYFSCQKQQEDMPINDEDFKSPEELIKPFFADNYPVTEKMFGRATADRPIVTEHLRSENTAWFANDSLKQTLMFILSSDNSRIVSACFDQNQIPKDAISIMDFSDSQNYRASRENSFLYFNEFSKSAKKIEPGYFISNMGFKIGDGKEKALERYGKADSIKIVDGFEKYYWTPAGAQITRQNVPEKDLLLIDEKKQLIIMYFKSNKLATLIFDNTPKPGN